MDDAVKSLAGRLRAERERRGWSITDLAGRAGVSKSMISKIERDEASPTAALLGRMSGAFGMTMSSLLEDQPAVPSRLVRRAEQSTWRDPATGYLRRTVCAPGRGRVEVTEVVLPPGATVAFPKEAYAFTEHQIWMRKGALHFVEGKAVHELRPGDHLTLGPPSNCRYENRQKTECIYLVMLTRSR